MLSLEQLEKSIQQEKFEDAFNLAQTLKESLGNDYIEGFISRLISSGEHIAHKASRALRDKPLQDHELRSLLTIQLCLEVHVSYVRYTRLQIEKLRSM